MISKFFHNKLGYQIMEAACHMDVYIININIKVKERLQQIELNTIKRKSKHVNLQKKKSCQLNW